MRLSILLRALTLRLRHWAKTSPAGSVPRCPCRSTGCVARRKLADMTFDELVAPTTKSRKTGKPENRKTLKNR